MANDIVLGIKLTADGKGLTGEVRMSADSLRDLASETGKANVAAQKAAESQRTLGQQVRALAAEIGVATAVWKGYQAIKESALASARFETLGISMYQAGKNAGYTRSEMDALQASLERTGISMMESRNTLIQMAAANMELNHATGLARAAQDLAVVGNLNSSEAFNRLVYGIQSAQTEVLRTIGINVSFEDGYKRLADQLHKNANVLTEHEKMQARTNAALEAAARYQGIYEEAMGTAGKQLTSLARYQENYKVILGETFNETLAAAVGAYTAHLKESTAAAQEMKAKGDLKQWGRDMALVLAVAADSARMLGNTVGASAMVIAQVVIAAKMLVPTSSTSWSEDIATLKDLQEQKDKFTAGMADNLKIYDAVNEMFAASDERRNDAVKKSAQEYIDVGKRAAAAFAAYEGYGKKTQEKAYLAVMNASTLDWHGRYKAADPDAGKIGADPNARAIAGIRMDAFRAEMELMGVAAEQVKVYGLAMAGATKEQIKEAQAAAETTLAIRAGIETREAAQKAEEKRKKDEAKAADEALRQQRELSQGQMELAGMTGKNSLYGLEGNAKIEAERAIAQAQEDSRYQVQMESVQREAELMAGRGEMTVANQALLQARVENLAQQHEARKLSIVQQHETAAQRFKKMSGENQVHLALQFGQQMLGDAAQHSRAAFNANKALKIAQGVIDMRKSIMSAYDWGTEMGGPWAGAAMAAVAGAAQLANLNAIRQAEFGGGEGGAAAAGGGSVGATALPGQIADSGVVASPSRPSATEPAPIRRDVNVYLHGLSTLRPGDLIDAALVRDKIIPELVSGIKDGVGGANINLVFS